MPIYEFQCLDCNHNMEILIASNKADLVVCGKCGGRKLKKLMSAHAVTSQTEEFPSNHSDRCCGVDGPPATCAGPGSCCGR